MNDYVERQLLLIGQFIGEYRRGDLNLNTLIQRIEALSCVIDNEHFKNAVFPIVLKIEEINAVTLEDNSKLSANNEKIIYQSLQELEQAIQCFQRGLINSQTVNP